ncbi:uncharacterized protein Dana_GF16456 [Drosophila ananassae]|uniref:TIR domain-containing protein n=1 Tax=Drosophila ananassae TaxID=7217 RepID=B3M3C1_DROAN|nr:protein toll [Drosophila ananassae]EDV43582.1 uncharacterized protein Dana_GF16456 [Drosophila ananassae]
MRRPKAACQMMVPLLAVLLQMVQWPAGVAAFGRDECNEMSINMACQCSPVMSEFEIICPAYAENPKFRMSIQPSRSFVQIVCNLTDTSDYKQLPKVRIGEMDIVQMQRCLLPGYTPIAGILENLGMPTPQMLIFESDNLGMNVTRTHFERLHGLKRLRFTSRRPTHIPANLLNDLRNLSALELRANIAEMPAHLFDNLENLESIEFGSNQLKHLPRGIFSKMPKLKHLNLWSNQLHNLTKYDFEGATSVLDIDLHANGIEVLPHDVFFFMPNLREINLSANLFRSLPEGLFEHNTHLQQVRISNNRAKLTTLPSRLFANLPELKVLFLKTDLESLPGDLLEGSTGITNISLASNRLTTLPAKLLEYQSNLLSLDLSHNQLTHLPDGIFEHNKELKDLNLESNYLTGISSKLFSRLISLETLIMRNNRLNIIDHSAFTATTWLRHLYLEHNNIDLQQSLLTNHVNDPNSPFSSLLNLETLNLSHNSIMVIYYDWKILMTKLHTLDLSYNNISSLNFEDIQFISRNKLEVNLTHNKIRSIHLEKDLPGYSTDSSIVNIDLNDNPLDCDCTMLYFVQLVRGVHRPSYSKYFKFQTDRLVCSKPSALEGTSVKRIMAEKLLCPFDSPETDMDKRMCPQGCSCWVRTFDKALLVNCNNGNMTRVPRLPKRPQNLVRMELHMENNTLLNLPSGEMNPGYSEVTSLHVAGNNLTEITTNQLPSRLDLLDLRRNHLQLLNATLLGFLNHTMLRGSMKLSGNPWKCDCDAKQLLLFTQDNFDRIEDRGEMMCMNAEHPTRMVELSTDDICPADQGVFIALAMVIATAGLLVGFTAALYYKYQTEIKIWLYAHNMLLWFVTEEELDKDKKFDAFISYSHKDQSFIEQLVQQLEGGPQKFQLCVHERDWLVGGFIPENIMRSVSDSRRTIIVLSQNFIESEWARMEFRAAHRSALNEGRSRIIIIVYSDIGDVENLDEELKAYLKMNTYLKWGDPWFWDRLRFALPHRKPIGNMGNGALIKSPLKGSTDDKLELIKPSPVTPPLTTPPAEATKNPLVAQLNGSTPHTAIMIANGKNGLTNLYTPNGKSHGNGHINGAFIINTNAKQSDV